MKPSAAGCRILVGGKVRVASGRRARMSATATAMAAKPAKVFVYRHTVLVRITHWINVIAITFLVMSGLQIFNARPDLYWGQQSNFDAPDPQPDARAIRRTARSARRRSSAGRSTRPAFSGSRRCRRRTRRRAASRPGLTVPSYQRPRHRPALAFLLRLGLRHQRRRLPDREPAQPPCLARPPARRASSSATSGRRSGTTCSSNSRTSATTTSSRSSSIWP